MPTRDEAAEAILQQIIALLSSGGSFTVIGPAVKDLAEAWAWLSDPSQPHGGGGQSARQQ
jgi:hypothetical protein